MRLVGCILLEILLGLWQLELAVDAARLLRIRRSRYFICTPPRSLWLLPI